MADWDWHPLDVLSSSSDHDPSRWLGPEAVPLVLGVVLYGCLFLIIGAVFSTRLRFGDISAKSVPTLFYAILLLFLAARVAWWALQLFDGTEVVAMLLNRTALCAFLVGFTCVLLFWADTVHTTVSAEFAQQAARIDLEWSYLSSRTRAWMLSLVALIVLFTVTFGVVSAVMYSGDEMTGNLLYRINVLSISGLFLLFAFGFQYYGLRLYRRLRDSTVKGKSRVLGVAALVCVCFTARFVMFSIHLFDVMDIPPGAFFPLAFYVPELVPSVLFVWLINKAPLEADSTRTPLIGGRGRGASIQQKEAMIPGLMRSASQQRMPRNGV
eukprot:m51a1_g8178 hypothetical protein (325) ;mRNA; f:119296-120772